MNRLLQHRGLVVRQLLAAAQHTWPHRPRPALPVSAPARCLSSGGLFDSLTSSMNATFKKLLGRKTLSRQEVDAALASVQDALVDADVAQVQQPLPLLLDNHTHKPAAI